MPKYFSIHGFKVEVNSKNEDILTRLEHDFSLYKGECHTTYKKLQLNLISDKIDKKIIPHKARLTGKSKNSLTFDLGATRYNDYYGKAMSIFNYENETATIISPSLERLHELAYLLILSRSGKYMDICGLHKIHAFGISKNNKNLIGMLPMKGGKTTLFLSLVTDKSVSIISDDTPLVDSSGNIYPFAIRVGMDNPKQAENLKNKFSEAFHYTLSREHYGMKYLMDIMDFPNHIHSPVPQEKIILFAGRRNGYTKCTILKCSKIRLFPNLFINLIIGVGLPMIREYFVEKNIRDSYKIIKIFFSRLKSSVALLLKAKTYIFNLSENPVINAEEINRFLDS